MMIMNGGEGWEREGEDSAIGQTERWKPFWGALSVSWSLKGIFFSFTLFRLLYNECSGAAAFFFPLFFFRSWKKEDRR